MGGSTFGPKTLGGCPVPLTSGPHSTSQEGHTQGCLLIPAAFGGFSRRPRPSATLNDSSWEIRVTHFNFLSTKLQWE